MMDKDKMKYLRDRPLTEEEKAFSEATAAIKEFQTTSSEASDDDDI